MPAADRMPVRRVWRDAANVPGDWAGCVATIGVFDGFHRGHQAVVAEAVAVGAGLGLPTVLVTFDPHPLAVVDPARCPILLTSLDERCALALGAGIDIVFVYPFTSKVANTPAPQWISDFLVDVLDVRAIVVGADFRFGAGNLGDVSGLRQVGPDAGFRVHAVPLVSVGGARCSSTRARALLAQGLAEDAARLLGRAAG